MHKPTLSFTIPSLKDESLLDCRVYIPESLLDVATPSRSAASSASEGDAQRARRSNGATQNGHADKAPNVSGHTKRKKAAVIAHPYAPLGGSFDDYIVQEIGGILLEEGFVVGLFNFRYRTFPFSAFRRRLIQKAVLVTRKAGHHGVRSPKWPTTAPSLVSWLFSCTTSTYISHAQPLPQHLYLTLIYLNCRRSHHKR